MDNEDIKLEVAPKKELSTPEKVIEAFKARARQNHLGQDQSSEPADLEAI